MKKILTAIVIFMFSLNANSQNCIKALSSSAFSNPSNDGINWILTLNWEADGQKHMYVTIKVNNTIVVNNNCFTVQAGGGATGTKIYVL